MREEAAPCTGGDVGRGRGVVRGLEARLREIIVRAVPPGALEPA